LASFWPVVARPKAANGNAPPSPIFAR
jgi:hypothetical protein